MAEQAEDAIKGAALGEFVRWYAESRSPVELRHIIGDLPEHARVLFDPASPTLGVLPSTWYPASVIHSLLDAMTVGMSRAERGIWAAEGGEVVMRRTLSGIYRALVRVMATPERYPRFAPRIWTQYYRSGQFIVENEGSARAVSRIREWRSHHPVLCEMNSAAGAVIYEVMGCRGVEVRREACVDDGDAECRFITTWKPPRT
jgi:hypothetical protein